MAERWLYKNELAQQAGVSLDCISDLCLYYEDEIKKLYPRYKRRSKQLPPVVVAFLKEKYVVKEDKPV